LEVVGLNKCDALTDEMVAEKRAALEEASGAEVMVLSGAAGIGVDKVLYRLLKAVRDSKAENPDIAPAPATKTLAPERAAYKTGRELDDEDYGNVFYVFENEDGRPVGGGAVEDDEDDVDDEDLEENDFDGEDEDAEDADAQEKDAENGDGGGHER
jgi:GTPase